MVIDPSPGSAPPHILSDSIIPASFFELACSADLFAQCLPKYALPLITIARMPLLAATSPKLLRGHVKRGVPSGYVVKSAPRGSSISAARPVPMAAQLLPNVERMYSTISLQLLP